MKLKTLYSYVCGSTLYGSKKTTDRDISKICIDSDMENPRLYPEKRIEFLVFNEKEDVRYTELCVYFSYLLNGSPLYIESLFIDNELILSCSDLFKKEVLEKKHLFIDRIVLAENVYQNTSLDKFTNLSNVKEKVKLPENPRAKQVELKKLIESDCKKYGFYRKELAHAIRILNTTLHFLKTNKYDNKLLAFDENADNLYNQILNEPQNIKFEEMCSLINEMRMKIQDFETKDEDFVFDTTHCVDVIKKAYYL